MFRAPDYLEIERIPAKTEKNINNFRPYSRAELEMTLLPIRVVCIF